MATMEELDALSTKELHDLAFARAKHRLDIAFFWRLLKAVPAAEAAAGHIGEARQDVLGVAERLDDVLHPDSPEEEEALRPIYVDYLLSAED